MEEVVEDVGIVYRSSFRLLESNNFKDESFLDLLRGLYIIALAEVDVVKRMRTQSGCVQSDIKCSQDNT